MFLIIQFVFYHQAFHEYSKWCNKDIDYRFWTLNISSTDNSIKPITQYAIGSINNTITSSKILAR